MSAMNTVTENSYYAHTEAGESKGSLLFQLLDNHLLSVALLAAAIGKPIGCYYIMLLLGLFHDIGKACKKSQGRLLGVYRLHVNHSSAGAIYLLNMLKQYQQEIAELGLIHDLRYCELLFYPLLAHHGLFDLIGKGQNLKGNYVNRIMDRMCFAKANTKEDFEDEIEPFVRECLEPKLVATTGLSLKALLFEALKELNACLEKIHKIGPQPYLQGHRQNIKEQKLYEGYLTRLFLSMLKTADCFDSSQWAAKDPIKILSQEQEAEIFKKFFKLTEARAEHFASLQDQSPLNKARVQLSEAAQAHAVQQSAGISQLDMPTGAGKTETGLRYAINNIHTFNKSRMLYVAPFLSIVEQSAQCIKATLGEEFVLEHHSNVVNDEEAQSQDDFAEDQSLYRPQTYIKEYWDSPIIVTTMVQFYDTLFAGKASNICRFCKLIDSTIIIDEIQSVPVEHIYLFNTMLNFLAQFMDVNVVLCTATQPPLDTENIMYPLYLSALHQVIPDEMTGGQGMIDLGVFERSKIYPLWSSPNAPTMTSDEFIERMAEELTDADSLLCILNTKYAVKLLYNKFSEIFPEAEVIYLSTNLCAAHRLDCIQKMREQLKQNRECPGSAKKLICITTSLIEAGVNVDFDIVCRSIAGADSLEQARGRCNREGLLRLGGKVFVFRLKEDNTDNRGLLDIYKRGEITAALVNDFLKNTFKQDLALDMQALTHSFYEKYFLENAKIMNLPLPDLESNGIDLLSTNDRFLNGLNDQEVIFKARHKLWQAFDTAARNMHLIDQDMKSLIVPYHNSTLIHDLLKSIDKHEYAETKSLLRKLQRYTVNVPSWRKLEEYCIFYPGNTNEIDSNLGIYILREDCYGRVCGIQIDQQESQPYLC